MIVQCWLVIGRSLVVYSPLEARLGNPWLVMGCAERLWSQDRSGLMIYPTWIVLVECLMLQFGSCSGSGVLIIFSNVFDYCLDFLILFLQLFTECVLSVVGDYNKLWYITYACFIASQYMVLTFYIVYTFHLHYTCFWIYPDICLASIEFRQACANTIASCSPSSLGCQSHFIFNGGQSSDHL